MLPGFLNSNLSLSSAKKCNFCGPNFDGLSSPMVYFAATAAVLLPKQSTSTGPKCFVNMNHLHTKVMSSSGTGFKVQEFCCQRLSLMCLHNIWHKMSFIPLTDSTHTWPKAEKQVKIFIFVQTFWALPAHPAQPNSSGISKCYTSAGPKMQFFPQNPLEDIALLCLSAQPSTIFLLLCLIPLSQLVRLD